MIRRRRKPRPDVLPEFERIVIAEDARRRSAFEAALSEMRRPRLTTEAILDGYLALVMAGDRP